MQVGSRNSIRRERGRGSRDGIIDNQQNEERKETV